MRQCDALGLTIQRTNEVRLGINGCDLIELVREAEQPFAAADQQPELAGNYAWLWRGLMLPPSLHLLGVPDPEFSTDGKPFVRGCICGIAECWPLFARIDVAQDTVTWSEFGHGFRSHWRYDALGPFVFQRSEYETALQAAHEEALPVE